MKSSLSVLGAALATLVATISVDQAQAVDIKRAAPRAANVAVYARENDERAYQREYLEEAWKTFKDEEIGERVVKIIASRAPKDKFAKVEEAWRQVKDALEPVNWDAIADADEFVYAQQMKGPFQQYLLAFRVDEEDAEGFEEGVVQLFELAAERSDDKVSVQKSDAGETEITMLRLPEKSPYHPAVAHVEDVALFCTDPDMLAEAVNQLQDESAESKFDDPRVKEALKHLPEPEDALTFFDGRQLFESLGGIGDFIRKEQPDNEKAERFAEVFERVLDEVAIIDYEVCVEYTEDGQNRVAAIGKLADDYQDKLLGKALTDREPFDDWQRWVPADATAYSLGTGLDCHVLYAGALELVREEFPESHDALEQFEARQEKLGVNIDKDILQSFSGEHVCVTVPVEVDGKETQQTVAALRCDNPDRIRELLGKAFEALSELPAVQAQKIELADAEDLEGFQELSGAFLQMTGARPVIGFHDGWMIVSTRPEAAAKVIAVRKGDADSIDGAESLARFDLEVDGETFAVSYQDVGAGVRQAADFIDKVGTTLPMFVGMLAPRAKPEDMKPVQEAIGLLPSIAKVVRKFDFFEHKFSIVYEGPEPNTYLRESVTEVRQAEGR